MAKKVFRIPAAEGYRSLADSYQPAEVAAVINGVLTLDISQRYDDQIGEARSLLQLGSAYARQGKLEIALDSLRMSLALFRSFPDLGGQAECLLELGRTLRRGVLESLVGDGPGGAVDALRQALALFGEIGDVRGQADCLLELGRTLPGGALEPVVDGTPGDAVDALRRSLTLFRDLGDLHGQAESLLMLGSTLRRSTVARPGRDTAVNDIRAVLEESLELFRSVGDARGQAEALLLIGRTAQLTPATRVSRKDAPDDAIGSLERALILFRDLRDLRGEAECLLTIGRRLGAGAVSEPPGDSSRLHEALASFGEALTIYRKFGEPGRMADVLLGMAEAQARLGYLEDAFGSLQEARSLFLDLNDSRGLERTDHIERVCRKLVERASEELQGD